MTTNPTGTVYVIFKGEYDDRQLVGYVADQASAEVIVATAALFGAVAGWQAIGPVELP